jgi:hypothetical protein
MRIGIVGSEGAKFTPETEALARQLIRQYLSPGDTVVSGQCHLGGIDIWAVEEAKALGLAYTEHPPPFHSWANGYKVRNIQIARDSELVICITVKALPPGYTAQGFEHYCYHCQTDQHVKSGGCWTVKYAKSIGKEGYVFVVG